MPRRIDEEELCRKYLDDFLRTKVGSSEIRWVRVSQDDQPPDYYLELPGAKFAVEVTSLVETVSVGGKELPAMTYAARCGWLAKEIERRAKEEGVLRGRYAFCVIQRPGISSAERLVPDAVSYIRQTMGVAEAPERVLLRERGGVCSIRKLGAAKDCVSFAGSLAKREADAERETLQLLRDRVSSKVAKLQNVRARCLQIILLLYDAYLYADWRPFETQIKAVEGVDFFHSVFLVGSVAEWVRGEASVEKQVGHEGQLIYDRDGAWGLT